MEKRQSTKWCQRSRINSITILCWIKISVDVSKTGDPYQIHTGTHVQTALDHLLKRFLVMAPHWNLSAMLDPDIEKGNYNAFFIVELAIYLMFVPAVITLNILSIAAVKCSKREMSAQHYFLINLSVGDVCLALTTLAQLIALHLEYDSCELFYIKNNLLAFMNMAAEMGIMLLGFDLYAMVFRPITHHDFLSPRRAKILVSATWFVAVVMGTNLLTMASIGSLVKGQDICDVKLVLWVLKVSAVIGSVYVPVASFFTLFLYGIIVNRLFKDMSEFWSERRARKCRKAFLTIAVILLIYLVAYIPMRVIYIYAVLVENTNTNLKYCYRGVLMLTLVNGVCDPLIYSIRMPNIRAGYRILFKRCRISKQIPRNQGRSSVGHFENTSTHL